MRSIFSIEDKAWEGLSLLDIYKKEDNLYILEIEQLIYFETRESAIGNQINLLTETKQFLEKNICDFLKIESDPNVKCNIYCDPDSEIYGVEFRIPDFSSLKEIYAWVNKAIDILHRSI